MKQFFISWGFGYVGWMTVKLALLAANGPAYWTQFIRGSLIGIPFSACVAAGILAFTYKPE